MDSRSTRRGVPEGWRAVLLIGLLALAAIAATAEAALERGTFRYEGRSLHWFCSGSGSPTLVLEAPSGVSNEEAWGRVLPALAERSRVCAYERAAYGGSDPLETGVHQTTVDYAAELRAFLELGVAPAPHVLLGFSYGGFVARYYAGHHPEDVAGLLLVDSPHVRWFRAMRAEMSAEDWAKVEDIMDWFLDNRGHDVWESQFEVEGAPALPPDLPLVVLTRGLDHDRMRQSGISEAGFRIYNDTHFRLAPELLSLTNRTRGITAENSDHMIPDAEPDVLIAAVDELLAMLEDAPSGAVSAP